MAKADSKTIHPAQAQLLAYFDYGHLPPHLAGVARIFHDAAHETVDAVGQSPTGGAEATTALRKLLEAKDCAVRAALPIGPVA